MLANTIFLVWLMPEAVKLIAPGETIVIPVMFILLMGVPRCCSCLDRYIFDNSSKYELSEAVLHNYSPSGITQRHFTMEFDTILWNLWDRFRSGWLFCFYFCLVHAPILYKTLQKHSEDYDMNSILTNLHPYL